MEKLRLLDLFSGIGGFSLGLERSGYFETVAFCEIEPFCRRVLAKHWPKVHQYDDIRTLTADVIQRDGLGRIDAICGGFPCQDISTAGKGAGITAETRSGLWFEYRRLIGELRPRVVIVENVAALLGRGLGIVLGDLAALGYDIGWRCIPASQLGAVHHRDRVWIVANAQQDREGRASKPRLPIAVSQSIERILQGWDEGVYPDAWEERGERRVQKSISELRELSWGKDCGSVEDIIQLAAVHTPSLCRTDDGISRRVDRVGALGNAVVPQIPEILGRAIGETLFAE